MHSLIRANTWTITKLPANRKLICCKWVFKQKLNVNGNVEPYTAQLVVKGYSQQHGIDYDETFMPVAKFTSIRMLLAIGAALDLKIHQMDVVTTFLNGDLKEDVYINIPEGIGNVQVSSNVGKVCTSNNIASKCQLACKLNQTLYSLKQSPHM